MSAREARDAKHQRMLEQAQLDEVAAYDGNPDGVLSDHDDDSSDFGRIPNDPTDAGSLSIRADSSIADAPSGGYPSFGEPLPGVDNLVTVQELRAVIQE